MKVNCTNPKHKDSTPSMEIYSDGGFCFSCGWVDKDAVDLDAPNREPENIGEKLDYIKSLPRMEIRGLELPYDAQGYYIVWPSGVYYKQRLEGGRARYLGPKGHRAPLLEIPGSKQSLVIIEGELNALSLSKAFKGTIVSPGSATELSRHFNEYLTIVTIDAIVNLVVDRDPAGVAAGIELKQRLIKKGRRVNLVACEKDLNQILQDGQEEGIREWIKQNLEV